ncbi:unnamed protein product [Schistocephalus solidus]|uniref:Uncharacterized protein n=1 Tax=Schistocephalus solidus TaxID=70667 RepID=A0A183SAB8_SCHSO|nr:unnamed protein product [Schistocephalus solidus]
MGDSSLEKLIKELQMLAASENSAPPPEKLFLVPDFTRWEARFKDNLRGVYAKKKFLRPPANNNQDRFSVSQPSSPTLLKLLGSPASVAPLSGESTGSAPNPTAILTLSALLIEAIDAVRDPVTVSTILFLIQLYNV